MSTRQVINSLYNSCSYVISRDHTSWIVDCGDVDRILPNLDGRLCGVLLTHAHFDHIYGLNHLLTLFPDVLIYAHEAAAKALLDDKLNLSRYIDMPMTLNSPENIRVVEDGESVRLFDDVDALAVFTPGHNPGSVTWVVDDMVFTGDSYIPGLKTVTNMPQSNKAQAIESEALILRLAEHRTILPGHPANEQITQEENN